MTSRDAAILKALIATGCTPQQLAAAIDAMTDVPMSPAVPEGHGDIEARRAYEREKKQRQRAKSTPAPVPDVPAASPLIMINESKSEKKDDHERVTLVAEQVTRLCNGKRIGHLREEIARHLTDGVSPETIVATVQIVNRRKRGPPSTMHYYDAEIRKAQAQGRLPFGPTPLGGSSDFAARWAANTAKQLAERDACEAPQRAAAHG